MEIQTLHTHAIVKSFLDTFNGHTYEHLQEIGRTDFELMKPSQKRCLNQTKRMLAN